MQIIIVLDGMEKLIQNRKDYKVSEIIFYPFINAPPSDYSTLYTAAEFCKEEAVKIGMKPCIITLSRVS